LERLRFRDYLIEHPDVAKEYEGLKVRLAPASQRGGVAYKRGKTDFISENDSAGEALRWPGLATACSGRRCAPPLMPSVGRHKDTHGERMELFLFARFHAQPGCESALREAIKAVEAPTKLEPGCLAYQAFRSVRTPGEFYVHSRWRDSAAFELHASLPHTVAFIAQVESLIDHPLSVSLTEPLT
jgi:quinol monooxygenase YgiN